MRYNTAYFERDIPSGPSSLGETISATIGYRLAPVGDRLYNAFTYAPYREQGYDPLANIEGYEEFARDLAQATNASHTADIKSQIDRNLERRSVMADATIGTSLIAGLFDPINLVALPVGGPVASVGRAALRAGVSVAAVEAAYEVGIMQPFDPLQSAEESTFNVLTAALFGGAIGGAINIPASMRARTFDRTMQAVRQQFEVTRRLENLDGLTATDIANAAPRAERGFNDLTDDALQSRINELEGEAKTFRESAEAVDADPNLLSRAEELNAESQRLRNELGLRALENDGVDMADPYRIMPSWFTESAFYTAVTTPMKRALQSQYPTTVKEAFVKSFSDSGMALALNAIGKATPQSVFQRAAASNGRWVTVHDELSKLWAKDIGVSLTERLDINATDLALRARRSDDTFAKWRERINEKRMNNMEGATEGEIKAIEALNRYFKDAESRLEDVGLIGTKRGLENKIKQMESELSAMQARARNIETKLKQPKLTKKNAERFNSMRFLAEDRIKYLEGQLESSRMSLAAAADGAESAESFLPRFWDHAAIKKNRAELEETLFRWYSENPRVFVLNRKTGQWETKELSTAEADIRQRAKETVDTILNESDPTNVDGISFGYGRSKHFRHRQVDIPNRLVSKFISTDPLAVMKTYSMRIEPRYEYAKQFGKDVDGVMTDMELDMLEAGASTKEINEMRRDYLHMYDRIAGAVIRDPSALNQSAAYVLKELAQASYMGTAGLAALPDFGRIIMEYDMPNVIKGVQALMDKNMVNLTVDEVRKAGEAIDILRGTAHLRLSEGMSNNVDTNHVWTQARNAFFILNGLAPMTGIAKQLAGIIDAHTIIDYSIKLTKGQLDDQSRVWLARYNIDEAKAAEIARAPYTKTDNGFYLANTDAWADSIYLPEIQNKTVTIIESNADGSRVGKTVNGVYKPAFYNSKSNTIRFDREYIEGPMFREKAWLNPKVEGVEAMPDIFETPKQWSNFVMLHEIMHSRFSAEDLGFSKSQKVEYENRINELALEEYRNQRTINQETVDTFRASLNSGVLNTIMSGTPADKPIITDGVAYIPMSVASKFGMKEDARFRGYARIENGLMALPFQFYSYTLANVNKTVGALATGQVKNRAVGIATMMGLAYLALKLRTPEFAWEQMSWQDRFARSFDMSGVMALYSDLFYTSLHTSLALGGPNITNGLLAPKFPQEPNMLDAITGVAGAAPSWLLDTARGAYAFAEGDYGGGGKTIVRNLPFARLWFLKEDVNQITRAWAN